MGKAGVAAPTVERKVWSREVAREAEERGEAQMPREWEQFMHGSDACFWGLTWDEGMMARRLSSLPTLNQALQKEAKIDDDLLQLNLIVLSARGGDGPEFAYDPAKRMAPTLLKPGNREDLDLLKSAVPSGRLTFLAKMVDQLSTLSLPKISEQILFFQAVNICCSGLLNSAIPSIMHALNNYSEDSVKQALAELARMQDGLTDMNALAETLGLGLSTRGRLTPEVATPRRSRSRSTR